MIARGLHTNADHKWLYDEESSTSTNHKLICSICNCVKYVDNLSEYTYDIISNVNMVIAVLIVIALKVEI